MAGPRVSRALIGVAGLLLLVAVAGAAAIWIVGRMAQRVVDPDPVTIASASLQGLREQNRLSAFAARYVAVVTSRQTRLGLSAERTLILPGLVRYEIDMAELGPDDIVWDAPTRTMRVRLPPIAIVGPQIDLTQLREYDAGGILLAITDAEERLDAANRRAGQAELVRQAGEPVPMKLARDATRRAVERSFALPLRAAGVDARVEAFFPDEPVPGDDERWDVTRSIQQVLADRQPR